MKSRQVQSQHEKGSHSYTQLKAAESSSYSQFSTSCRASNASKRDSSLIKQENTERFKETDAEAESRAKTRRSPSLMSSKTLHPSEVSLEFKFGLVDSVFDDILFILIEESDV